MRLRTLALAIAGLALAGFAWRDAAVAQRLGNPSSPAAALFAGTVDDPRIALAGRDPLLLFGAAKRADAIAVRDEARAILRRSPLEAAALAQYGLAAALLGENKLKRRLLLAERISRRDPITQAVLLSLATAEDDYPLAFAHVDTALTVKPAGGAQLYPALAPLTANPAFRSALARYARRPWFPDFLAALVLQPTADPGDIARLMLARGAITPAERETLLPPVLRRLAETGQYRLAGEVAVRLGKLPPAVLGDIGFSAASSDPLLAPLTWLLHSDETVQASLHAGNGVEASIVPGASAVVAERLTQLAPGSYRLEQVAGAADATPGPRLEWSVSCKSGAAQRVVLQQPIVTGEALLRYRWPLLLPADCPLQYWQLKALAPDQQTSASFRIAALRLHRDP